MMRFYKKQEEQAERYGALWRLRESLRTMPKSRQWMIQNSQQASNKAIDVGKVHSNGRY
jgi:hypothetical protein